MVVRGFQPLFFNYTTHRYRRGLHSLFINNLSREYAYCKPHHTPLPSWPSLTFHQQSLPRICILQTTLRLSGYRLMTAETNLIDQPSSMLGPSHMSFPHVPPYRDRDLTELPVCRYIHSDLVLDPTRITTPGSITVGAYTLHRH
jgi:hypothetical protein